jgi:hypothetical protein
MNFPSWAVTKPGGTVESIVRVGVGVDVTGAQAKVKMKKISAKIVAFFLFISLGLYRQHSSCASTG